VTFDRKSGQIGQFLTGERDLPASASCWRAIRPRGGVPALAGADRSHRLSVVET